MKTARRSLVPSAALTTRAMAETRTPSAKVRVMRNVRAAMERMRGPKAFFDESIGGKEIAAKITRQQHDGNQYAADEVAEHQLEKGQVSGIGDGRDTDDGQGGGFGGNDREGQRPPGRGAAAEKIISGAVADCDESGAQAR